MTSLAEATAKSMVRRRWRTDLQVEPSAVSGLQQRTALGRRQQGRTASRRRLISGRWWRHVLRPGQLAASASSNWRQLTGLFPPRRTRSAWRPGHRQLLRT